MSVSRGREDSAALAGIENGYAPLSNGLLVPRAYLPQIAGLLHNMSSASNPTINDDSGDGYAVGSRWLNTSTDTEYICLDATAAAAIWVLTGSKVVTYTPAWTSTGTAPAIVNGTITGEYIIMAPGLAYVYIQVAFGSSTTYGTGTYYWSLPAIGTFSAGINAYGCAQYRDASSTNRATGLVTVEASDRLHIENNGVNVGSWGATVPYNPPASGDAFQAFAFARFT